MNQPTGKLYITWLTVSTRPDTRGKKEHGDGGERERGSVCARASWGLLTLSMKLTKDVTCTYLGRSLVLHISPSTRGIHNMPCQPVTVRTGGGGLMEREGWIRRHDRKEKEKSAPPPTYWSARKGKGKFHVAALPASCQRPKRSARCLFWIGRRSGRLGFKLKLACHLRWSALVSSRSSGLPTPSGCVPDPPSRTALAGSTPTGDTLARAGSACEPPQAIR
ncbi:hypothetical protein MAPG_08252 [Magnaporthiopsis poae ATCC 64411]|uniref:Uncharacterized protein n=1 Tax=Magnaporthiopsis poae (strain ATCC 64411 / 73-15) TaxID=644358 RepID=A0A0C4E6V5_MAGP6|nr:hypothetical protein MAPG_08252 [Magnaporthiopsis poae ATCC 64411]